MKRSSWIVIVIIILVVLIGGGYALFHNSSNPYSSNNPGGSSVQNNTASGNGVYAVKTDPSLGQYLADPAGKPLYTYNADTSGVSNCTGSCLSNWPAYQPTSTLANLPSGVSTIKRSDNGQTQYTYNGKPLYYFTGDSAGKVTGDGVENFSVAKPSTSSQSAPSNSSTQNNNPYSNYP